MISRSDIQQAVIEQALSIPEGGGERGICPACGSTSAFSMSRTDSEVSYICFKLACGCRGTITSKGSGTSTGVKSKKVKLFNGELTKLSDYEIDYLMDTFLIEREWLNTLRFSEQDMRVYYPQYNIMGLVHGYIARHYPALDNDCRTKGAKAYWKPVLASELGLCFPNMHIRADITRTGKLCVVEDYPSMLRINSQIGIPTCCLGGTAIYDRYVSTMLALGVKELTILLDADAVVKAVKLKRGLSLAFDDVKIIPLLGADPKDMAVDELNKLFKRV